MMIARNLSRPIVTTNVALATIAVYLAVVANGSWWSRVAGGRSLDDPTNLWFVAVCGLVLIALNFTVLALVSARPIVRVASSVLVVASAATSHFMSAFAVVLDPAMMQNVLHTDARESSELLSAGLITRVLVVSAPAIALLYWVRLEREGWLRALGGRVAWVCGLLLIAALSVLSVSRDFSSLMRNERTLRYAATPANVVYGLARSLAGSTLAAAGSRIVVGADAYVRESHARPRVLVLVVGEAARAQNFSLLGYSRPTNPQLAQLDVVAFSDVTACGTSTEISLPCMFSPYGRADYDEQRIRRSEGLLNVLSHAQVHVSWRDNQSGCKGVCDGLGIERAAVRPMATIPGCTADGCHDEALLVGLDQWLQAQGTDAVLVLHQLGNHGPTYFARYPERSRRFEPACETGELRRCTREAVVNAYDNAIVYTDEILARAIEMLDRHAARLDTALVYVSDHGESLGEHGLYLHGMPYWLAPDEQKKVPLVLWLSQGIRHDARIDGQCLERRARQPASHDNLFHSVLGLLDVQTTAYRAERDLFDACRPPENLTAANSDRSRPIATVGMAQRSSAR
jgi:lipid A ethanolaminephosphotransferase